MDGSIELRIDTPFGELAALQWGDADAPPLLALHGWLDNAASFARLAPLLAARRRVIALDMPGHGHSAHLPESARRYHIVDQVDHVLDAADALGMERFDLLGHSLGAGIASLTAAAVPARIGRLLLVEGLGPLADVGAQTLARWRDAHARREAPRRTPRVFASIDDAVAARVAVGGLDTAEARPIVERNLREVDGGYAWRSDPRLRLTTPLRIEESQLRRVLAGIEAPTLVLLAEPATPYLPTALMQARAACVADIRIDHIAGPHHLHIRDPRETAAHILDFRR
ncbi:MAG: alpha/beta fold hydrolase [Rhodanobacteraceae bacterium]|nr:MAG: alpha/beta fold hydrolase [Rhodanobacteraceae bacterium]